MLRSRRAGREAPSTHVPDPVVTLEDDGPQQEALLAESVGLALLVVLEALTPAERVAFVLHDVFGVPFADIAIALDRSEAAAQHRSGGRCDGRAARGWGHRLPPLRPGREVRHARLLGRLPRPRCRGARWLIGQSVKVIGTDAPGLDRGNPYAARDFQRTGDASLRWEAHRVGIDHEYFQIEKLANLGEIPARGAWIACFPVKITGGSGGWCRAVAILGLDGGAR
jgi:hypothetical protein